MNIDELTLGQAREIARLVSGACGNGPVEHPYEVGEVYLIRQVTHYNLGRLTWVGEQELVLENAAWVADTGRWAEALRTGVLSEVEPHPDGSVVIGRGSIIDAQVWLHGLARKVIG